MIPEAYSTGTVTGHWIYGTGVNVRRGEAIFTPRAPALISLAEDLIMLPTPRTAQVVDGILVHNGSPGIELPATDDPDITPIGWTWKVEVRIAGLDIDPFDIVLPAGTTVDLSDVIEVDATSGTVQVVEGGGSSVTVSATAPEDPDEGDQWFDTTDGSMNVRVADAWVETNAPAPVSSVNGETGVVVLSAVDVGAATAADITTAVAPKANTADVDAALALKANLTDLPAVMPIRVMSTQMNTSLSVVQFPGTGSRNSSVPVITFPDGALTADAAGPKGYLPPIPWDSIDIYLLWMNASTSATGVVRWALNIGPNPYEGGGTPRHNTISVNSAPAAASLGGNSATPMTTLMASGVTVSTPVEWSFCVRRHGDHVDDTLPASVYLRGIEVRKAGT